VIHVPLSGAVRTITGQYPGSRFNNTCDLGIRTAETSTYLLGDTLLRSAYAICDIDHGQIALAQTNFEAPDSEINEIPSGATGIPLLSGQTTGLTQVPQSYFATIQTSLSAKTPMQLDITATAEVTFSTMSGLTSITGGGSKVMPVSTMISTPTSTSTEAATPSGSSATSKSVAVKTVSMFRKDSLDVLSVVFAGIWWQDSASLYCRWLHYGDIHTSNVECTDHGPKAP
jgi:hypothetical protein